MLITKHFVLVHLQKTGGMFIRNLCESHMPPDWIIRNEPGNHSPAREIPEELSHLPVLGFVRNPWDWYVSWYHYLLGERERLQGSSPESAWAVLFDNGRASFEQMVSAACSGIPIAGHASSPWLDVMRDHRVDYYTQFCGSMFAGRDPHPRTPPHLRSRRWGIAELGRFETLREDFMAFLDRHAVPVGEDFKEQVRASPAFNVGERGAYSSYYDPELRDLVQRTCRVVRRCGYSYDDAQP